MFETFGINIGHNYKGGNRRCWKGFKKSES